MHLSLLRSENCPKYDRWPMAISLVDVGVHALMPRLLSGIHEVFNLDLCLRKAVDEATANQLKTDFIIAQQQRKAQKAPALELGPGGELRLPKKQSANATKPSLSATVRDEPDAIANKSFTNQPLTKKEEKKLAARVAKEERREQRREAREHHINQINKKNEQSLKDRLAADTQVLKALGVKGALHLGEFLMKFADEDVPENLLRGGEPFARRLHERSMSGKDHRQTPEGTPERDATPQYTDPSQCSQNSKRSPADVSLRSGHTKNVLSRAGAQNTRRARGVYTSGNGMSRKKLFDLTKDVVGHEKHRPPNTPINSNLNSQPAGGGVKRAIFDSAAPEDRGIGAALGLGAAVGIGSSRAIGDRPASSSASSSSQSTYSKSATAKSQMRFAPVADASYVAGERMYSHFRAQLAKSTVPRQTKLSKREADAESRLAKALFDAGADDDGHFNEGDGGVVGDEENIEQSSEKQQTLLPSAEGALFQNAQEGNP